MGEQRHQGFTQERICSLSKISANVQTITGASDLSGVPAHWGTFRAPDARRSLVSEQVQSSEGAGLECVRINTLTPEWIWYHA